MVTSNSSKQVAWHTSILPADTGKALDYLGKQRWPGQTPWYLAGGTALALQVGHRTSQDLDFFNPKEFSAASLIKKFPSHDWKTTVLREGTIYGRLLGAKVSFIFYPFFKPRQPFLSYGSVRIMHEKDIAVMKIVAISQRGTKRDFVDLYWYCQNREPLLHVVQRLEEQYPNSAHNYHHVVKSLTYFEDAEADPMPKIFFNASWEEIKEFFRGEMPLVARDFLGLK